MKISEFYKMTKVNQRMFVIEWLNSKIEYSFQIRCIDVKKPQGHCFIECRDTVNTGWPEFDIEISRSSNNKSLYDACFNCSSDNPDYKRFKTHTFDEYTKSIEDVFDYMFEYCLWTGRHEYVTDDPLWVKSHLS